jgi:hypothetical protein
MIHSLSLSSLKVAACFVMALSVGNVSAANSPTVDTSPREQFAGVLKNHCLECHGEKKVKGDINLVDLLERQLAFEDVADWGRVFSEVQSGNMPPADEAPALEPGVKNAILSVLQSELGQSHGGDLGRMITPTEYKNAVADLFQLDLKNYDPFGDLQAYVSPEHRFHTVKSHRMMNRFYLNALMEGTERILREYTSDNKPLVGKPTTVSKGVWKGRSLAEPPSPPTTRRRSRSR